MIEMIEAGKLDKRVTIYTAVTVTNEIGEQVTRYRFARTTYAHVSKSAGSVVEDAGQIHYVYPLKLILRRYVEIHDFDVVQFDGQFYAIDSITTFRCGQEARIHSIENSLVEIIVEDGNQG